MKHLLEFENMMNGIAKRDLMEMAYQLFDTSIQQYKESSRDALVVIS